MTDPEALPEHEAAVRRLLSDARHDEPTPPEVVERLDSVLAGLVAERQHDHDHPEQNRPEQNRPEQNRPEQNRPVTVLAETRRRRRGASLLLAAAAVVVAGVGIGQVVTSGDDGADDLGGIDSSATEAEAFDHDAAGDHSARSTPPLVSAPDPGARLHTSTLEEDLLAARRQLPVSSYDTALSAACVVPDGPGDRLAVTLDGEPGVAVFGPVVDDEQVVDVFVCGTEAAAEVVRLPAP